MPKDQRPATPAAVSVRDVAALARVSPTTVSNVLSGNRRVSEETQDRVRWAIDQLGYRPNLSARNLRLNRTGLIAVAVPEIDVPYFAELIRHVVQGAREHGYTVLVDQTEGRIEAEQFVVDGMNRGMVDGILLSPLGMTRAEYDQRRDDTPLVLLGERIVGKGIDHVGIDNVAAAEDATRHLADRGRRRIAAIGHQTPRGGGTAPQRTKGYRKALRSAGLPYDPTLVVPTRNYHRLDGAQAMADLLDSGALPDAVFCYTDLLALGALHTLHQRGLKVPDEVAVIGIDDIDEGRYSLPTLTTISPNKPTIAQTALDLLLTRITTKEQDPQQVVIPHTLEQREST
ncbi:LacI family transcriptional regulator [Kribbella amoyensis]|uniref:LacI family transcriptional regulator n=1 Tax=Kribbella amoyensis TaxID=996641 RepID=A0A561BUY1_9ACTN|nr:LacI family DNA-binding transcriptional regulator [Kribbella amoyensis]TWD82603.1 LacI family transcriptional regulator [Kribbella amoyensis]